MKKMRSLWPGALVVALVLLMTAMLRAANTPAPDRLHYEQIPPTAISFHNAALDTAGTVAYRPVVRGTFTQMTSLDSFRIRSSNTADSSWTRLYFLKSDTTIGAVIVRQSGTDTVAVPTYQGLYFEKMVADSAALGTVTVYSKTGGAIAIIVPGQEESYGAFHFFSKGGGGLTGWGCSIDTTTSSATTNLNTGVRFQLRLYNRQIDAVNTPEQGYKLIDERLLMDQPTAMRSEDIPLELSNGWALSVPPAGYAVVYASSTHGSITTTRIKAYIKGYDRVSPGR